jgi:hypothetical protein
VNAVLVKAAIDHRFPTYSARHALITFLLRLGFSEVEVIVYTSPSNNSHTALSHYFHLDGNWAGRGIVKEALKEVPEKAEGIIGRDNKEQREEEGKEPEAAAESDAAGREREELVRFDWGREQSTRVREPASDRQATAGGIGAGGMVTSQEVDRAALRERVLDGLGQRAGQPPALRMERGTGGRNSVRHGEVDRVVSSDWGLIERCARPCSTRAVANACAVHLVECGQ